MSAGIQMAQRRVGQAQRGAFVPRSQFVGDPGLFGFLGDAIGTVAKIGTSFIPGPIGGIARTAVNALTGTQQQQPPTGVLGTQFAPVPQQLPSINPPFAGPAGVGVSTPFGRASFGEQQQASPNGGPPGPGYHLNKSGYFLKSGQYVPKGTRWVKNRRKNPLNPRAASRAISRIQSAKKATAMLDRVSVKCRRCGYASCRCKG